MDLKKPEGNLVKHVLLLTASLHSVMSSKIVNIACTMYDLLKNSNEYL